ncbi:MAG: sensor histidine kinase [Thermoleophilaceae bacterium]
MLQRLPIRVRVTLAFVAVMAVVFAGMGVFIYLRQGSELQDTIDQGLRSRAADITTLVREADSGLSESGRSPLTETGESVAQILDRRGRVVDAPPALRNRPIAGTATVRRATRGTILVNRTTVPTSDGETRLLATPVTANGDRLVVVVGASLEAREKSQHSLAAVLALAGLGALACAAAASFGVVSAALAPMEAMRRRAGAIQAAEPGARLPVPRAQDEVHRLGETLNSMLDRLEDAFTRERQFVSDASHELRTPIAILKGELELALWTNASPDELRAAISSAVEESDRLTELAEDLLVIARADHGRLPVRREDVDVHELLGTVSRRFQLRASEHGTEIVVEGEPGEAVEGDRLRLEQALGNLVENALRHGTGPVTLSAGRSSDQSAVLKVCDHGPGFGEGFAAYAFERFSREDSARARGGAGLGLAIVEAIVQAHGGGVRACNRRGGGAEVALIIPAAARDRAGVPAPT